MQKQSIFLHLKVHYLKQIQKKNLLYLKIIIKLSNQAN